MASKETVEFIEKCDLCGCTNLTTDYVRGEMFCSKCGNVLDIIIRSEPQGRTEDGEIKGHHGDPTKEGGDIGTDISTKGVKNRELAERLRRIHKMNILKNGEQRSMGRARPRVERIATLMGLPTNIVDESMRIYKLAIRKHLIRGRSIDNIVAASLYAACRRLNVSRTLDEFSEATGIKRADIGRTYRFLAQQLRLKIGISSPEEYTMRFCSRLKLSGKVCMKSQEIIREADALEITSGRGPTGVTAASIYIASIICHERRTQKEIAEASGVTEVTIRNRYREITQGLNISIEA